MEIDEILGLPAHPIIVHAAVALVPAAAILTVLAALWPSARRRIGWIGVVLAALAVVTVWMAQGSGEELEHKVEESHLVEEHAELGDQMLMPAIAMLVGAVLVTAVGRRPTGVAADDDDGRDRVGAVRVRGASALGVIVAVVAIATSGYAVVQVYRVGHSGAKAVWDETGKEGKESSGESGERDESEEGLGAGHVMTPPGTW
jgi:flagellar biosynthesis component FlhA